MSSRTMCPAAFAMILAQGEKIRFKQCLSVCLLWWPIFRSILWSFCSCSGRLFLSGRSRTGLSLRFPIRAVLRRGTIHRALFDCRVTHTVAPEAGVVVPIFRSAPPRLFRSCSAVPSGRHLLLISCCGTFFYPERIQRGSLFAPGRVSRSKRSGAFLNADLLIETLFNSLTNHAAS